MNIKKTAGLFVLGFMLSLSSLSTSAKTNIPTEGKTEVALSNELLGAMVFLGVKPGAVGPGKLSRKGISSLPITTGAIALPKAEIDHSGGISLSGVNTSGVNTRVVLSSLIIDTTTDKPVVTGLVIANGEIVARVTLAYVDLKGISVEPKGKKVTIKNAVLTLSQEAAVALNGLFGVTAFTENFPIGTATIKVTNSRVE